MKSTTLPLEVLAWFEYVYTTPGNDATSHMGGQVATRVKRFAMFEAE